MSRGEKSYWTLANVFSLGNILCGTLSIFSSASHHFLAASILMLGGVGCDFLDGKTARLFSQATFFGKGLDSLSDMISFGLAPAALGYALHPFPSWIDLCILSLFVFAGAWRLAYYMQWGGAGRPPGMPITVNGIAFPAAYFLHFPPLVFPWLFLISAFLMTGPIFLSRHPIS